MDIAKLITLSLVCINFLLIAECLKTVATALASVLPPLLGLLKRRPAGTVETPVEDDRVIPRYDVNAFRKRIEDLKCSADDDGLYDVPEEPARTDFTGAEIITDNFEEDVDKYVS